MGEGCSILHNGDEFIAVPHLVSFDRYAEMTVGLDATTAGGLIVVNGVALVTQWLSNSQWSMCYQEPSSSWTDCYSDPATVWSGCS